MRNDHPKPKLLAKKLWHIRDYLRVNKTEMSRLLQLNRATRITEYENGKHLPPNEVVLRYARAGKVHMEDIVDDEVSVEDFRKLLGTVAYKQPAK
jgi:DNA-binding XRE family transcriptional regulator